jgi:tetratricopeptide (TPR) repeat protein
VPEADSQELRLSELVPFSEAETLDPSASEFTPFSAAGVKFTPLVGDELNFAVGHDLKLFYQIWAPPAELAGRGDHKLTVQYAYGRPGIGGDVKTVRDDVLLQQFNASGSLVNGKKIALLEASPGSYLLTVSVSDPETQRRTQATLPFRVLPTFTPTPAWDVSDEGLADDVAKGVTDLQRGLCYLAQGKKEQAEKWFRRALRKDPASEAARAQLVDIDYDRRADADVVQLYAQSAITLQTGEQTVLHIAESLDRLGRTREAIEALEAALSLKSGSGPLYLALATYYQRLGNAQKALELEQKGKRLMGERPASP